jgi:hypothetical protein
MSRLSPSEMLVLLTDDSGWYSRIIGDLALLVVFGSARVDQGPGDGIWRVSALAPPDPQYWPHHLRLLHHALAAQGRPLAGGNNAGEVGEALSSALGGRSDVKSALLGGFMPGTLLYDRAVRASAQQRGLVAQRPVRRLFGLVKAEESCRVGLGVALGSALDRRLEASARLLPRMAQQDPPAALAAACALGTLLIAGCMSQKYGARIGAALMPLKEAASRHAPAPQPPLPFAPQAGEEAWYQHCAVPLPPEGVIATVDALHGVMELNLHMAGANTYGV